MKTKGIPEVEECIT